MQRYTAEPNNSAQPYLHKYKWRVYEVGENHGRVVAYTVDKETAEDYANQMNTKGYIEVDQ